MKKFKVTKVTAPELIYTIKVDNQYLQDIKCVELINSALKDLTNNDINLTPEQIKEIQKTILRENITSLTIDSNIIGKGRVYIKIGTLTTEISIYKNTDKYILEEI